MPAHSRGYESVESYLTRIISALCREGKGEVRLKGAALDAVATDGKISIDWDASTQEIVIRSISGFGEVYSINGDAWQKRMESPPQQEPKKATLTAISAPPDTGESLKHTDKMRVTTLDTERMAELENKLTRERLVAAIRKRQQEFANEPETFTGESVRSS
jgi:hypothetical protein